MQIINFLKTGKIEEVPDFQEMKESILKYPYFQGLLFYYLKSLYLHSESEFYTELRRLASLVSDRKALFYSVFSEDYAIFFCKTGKTELPTDRTEILLNAFFNQIDETFPKSQNTLDDTMLNSGIVSVDYFSYLQKTDEGKDISIQKAEKEESPELRHHEIIDSFIEKSDKGEDFKLKMVQGENPALEEKPESESREEDDSLDDSMFFTETLSRIYIKQKKYEKAYKIITQLSLNYPKKNSYFADQIRFLEKLIANSSKNTNGN